jgi:Golgi nucleoside diphosphatase
MPTKCKNLFHRYLCYNIATNIHICFGPIHQDPPQFTTTLQRNASILTISIFHSTSDAYKSDQLGFVPKYFVSLTTILCGLKRVGILSEASIILNIFRNISVHFIGLVSRKMVNGSFHKVRTWDDTLISREPWEKDIRFNFQEVG